jgi:hypothetical protein
VVFVVGIPVLVFLVALVYGGLAGRVRMTSCCSIADPRRDLRMRAAFEDADAPMAAGTANGGQTPVTSDRR